MEHEEVESKAEGVDGEDTVQLGAVPVRGIEDGSWIRIFERVVMLLFVVNVTLRDRGEETILTAAPRVTLLRVFGLGVIDRDPLAILFPDLETTSPITLGDVSTRQLTITFES